MSRAIEKSKRELVTVFEMVDLDLISFYLGLKVEQNPEKKIIKLSQSTYISKIFIKYYFDKTNSINISMKKATLEPNLSEAIQAKKEKYQIITRFLIFSIVKTRPNIIFSIVVATCFTKNLSYIYIKVFKIIL